MARHHRTPRPIEDLVLAALARSPWPVTRGELRMHRGFSMYPAGAIQVVLDRLEAEGRVRRVPAVHRRADRGSTRFRTWEGPHPAYELVEPLLETNSRKATVKGGG
jgi:hypothetical protein